MKGNKKILVIDDDVRLQEAVQAFLAPYGYAVFALHNGDNVLRELRELAPDIVLLDVMLPGEDGFTILQRIRSQSSVPVLILTAKGDDVDRIVGLEIGADDYLAKPFNPRELAARIKAILRRAGLASSRTPFRDEFVRRGEFVLDIGNKMLLRQNKTAPLSETEFHIVCALFNNTSHTLSRDKLLSLAFGEDYYANDRLIDVHISRIRRVLRQLGAASSPIRTVWGQGYRWVDEEAENAG